MHIIRATWPTYLLCCALLVVALHGAHGITPQSYLIPKHTHNRESGYTALEFGRDGRVYVGTALYAGSGHLMAFDPRTKEWESVFDAHTISRYTLTGLDSQSKIHAKILVDADGVIWSATKQGNEEFGTRPEYGESRTGYPGGHLYAYNPETRTVVDHGILKAQEGIMGGTIDRQRKRLYYVSDPKTHFLIYDIATNTVRDLGPIGLTPRYMTIDARGRVYSFAASVPGLGAPSLAMYDPDTDKLYQLAVQVEGPGAAEYRSPYVLIANAQGDKLFGNAIGGKYLMEFDLATINLNAGAPYANGTIVCRHVAEVNPAGDQRAGVLGKDGCYYFANGRLLFRYDPVARALVNLGEIHSDTFGPHAGPQGACVGDDGTLYLKYIYQYQVLVFDALTAPRGGR